MISIDLNTIIIIILIIYFFICVIKKISFKITFIIAIIFLGLAAEFFILEYEEFANTIATIAYYLFVVNVVLAVVEIYRNNRKEFLDYCCPYCETELKANSKYCSKCGKQLLTQKSNKY